MFPKFQQFPAKERILIFEVNWLGDVLFSTPAIRAIRKKHPGAYITALVAPLCREALMGNNYIDEVMIFDEERKYRGFKGKLRFLRDLRVRRFSTVYLFKSSWTRTFYLFLAGVKNRIGYGHRKGQGLLTERVFLPKADLHRADTYYYLVTKAKIPDGERYCDFFISSEDKIFIEDFLKKHGLGENKQLVVLHVGGNWTLKLWPKENFVKLIDALKQSYNIDVIISGSFLEYPLAREIARQTKEKPFVACGMTSLKQLGALFQKSDMVISSDSGPLHIAVAMQARTIALFGPTSPEITGPFGKGDFSILRNKDNVCTIPCYRLDCKDNICMSSLSVEQVTTEVQERGWLTKAV